MAGKQKAPAATGASKTNEEMETQAIQKVNRGANVTIRDRLNGDEFKAAVAAVLPRHLTPERFIRIAILATTRTPKLLECTQASLFNALLTLSQYGLEPDGRRAHLIPFENRRRRRPDGNPTVECQLIIDYKGLAELVMRSGLVANIHADLVCDADDFEFDRGLLVKHKIDFRKPRGNPYAAYALVRMKDGTEKCEVMSKEDIYLVRNKSSGYQAYVKKFAKENPWADPQSEPEMWKKTVFRRCTKWLPLSPEIRDMIEADDETKTTVDIDSAPMPQVVVGALTLPDDEGEEVSEVDDSPRDSAPQDPKAPIPPENIPGVRVTSTPEATVVDGAEPPTATANPLAESPALATVRRSLKREGIPEDKALAYIHQTFKETAGCKSLDEIDQHASQIIRALPRGWATFIKAVRESQGLPIPE